MKDLEDKNLQDYLSSRDGISDAYQSLPDEKPAAMLDATIRQAAQQAVEGLPKQKKRIPYQAYSIAASFCVAVLVVSLFLNNTEQFTRSELESVSSFPLSDAPRAELFSADEAAAPQLNAGGISADESLSIEQDSDLGLSVNRVTEQAEAAALIEERARAERLESAENITTQSRLAADAIDSLEEEQSAAGAQVQASAPLAAAQSADYRLNSDTWLREILRLSEGENTLVLSEERRLFIESYPAINIDSALAELAETD